MRYFPFFVSVFDTWHVSYSHGVFRPATCHTHRQVATTLDSTALDLRDTGAPCCSTGTLLSPQPTSSVTSNSADSPQPRPSSTHFSPPPAPRTSFLSKATLPKQSPQSCRQRRTAKPGLRERTGFRGRECTRPGGPHSGALWCLREPLKRCTRTERHTGTRQRLCFGRRQAAVGPSS